MIWSDVEWCGGLEWPGREAQRHGGNIKRGSACYLEVDVERNTLQINCVWKQRRK